MFVMEKSHFVCHGKESLYLLWKRDIIMGNECCGCHGK